MLSHIIYSLSFKMVYIVYLGQKRGARAPWAPSKSATGVAWPTQLLFIYLYGRVYVLTRVATRVVDRTCARIIALERDSTYSGRF